jgi:hypothetical protein
VVAASGYCILSSMARYTVGVTSLSCRGTVEKGSTESRSTGTVTDMHLDGGTGSGR